MSRKDRAIGELLGLLKTRPDLVHALVVDHTQVKRLLNSRAARRLVPGVNVRSILQNCVAHRQHGSVGMIFRCLKRSA